MLSRVFTVLILRISIVYLAALIGAAIRLREYHRTSKANQCGMIYFYHIPKTGGNSIIDWLINHETKPKWNHIEHFSVESYQQQMNTLTHNVTGWIFIEHHSRNVGMNETKDLVKTYKESVLRQGCDFISMVTFREPLEQTKSFLYYMNIEYKSMWNELQYGTNRQLHYFLHNVVPPTRDVMKLTKQTKRNQVKTAMRILEELFDIVSFTDDFPRLQDHFYALSGWKKEEIIHSHRTPLRNKYVISEDDIQKIKNLYLDADIDFWNELRDKYYLNAS